jgi:hypothetical protein
MLMRIPVQPLQTEAALVVRNVAAGLIVGVVAVTYAISYAAVIFAGDLAHALPMAWR